MKQPEVKIECEGNTFFSLDSLLDFQGNLKKLSEEKYFEFKEQLLDLGFSEPVSIWKNKGKKYILNGHQRIKALKMMEEEGIKIPSKIPCSIVRAKSRKQAKLKLLALTSQYGEFTKQGFNEFVLDAQLIPEDYQNFELSGLDLQSYVKPSPEAVKGSLKEMFGYPPFSVMNAREAVWQTRKRAWISLGIKSEIGRGDNLLKFSEVCNKGGYAKTYGTQGNISEMTGTSIFDPVLCEILYNWFCPPAGHVLDPFAGGSVRGIIAYILGLHYTGVDLRKDQIKSNSDQLADIMSLFKGDKKKGSVSWIAGDSQKLDKLVPGTKADFILSCPPYGDLEKYSNDPADISTMPYQKFRAAYANIISKACAMLKPDSFACFVVGEIRDKAGHYQGFIPDTIRAFESAGLKFYNEIILVTAVGSLALRAGKQMKSSRKVGKTHQNILVFVKGDAKKAAGKLSDIHFKESDITKQEADIIQ